MDPKNRRLYTGRSGQMAVMAELLAIGCNVAVPEVDVGEDLFAFRDGQPVVDRLQVKSANATRLKAPGRYSADVSVPIEQLKAADIPELIYVFAIRLGGIWSDFVIIPRYRLYSLQAVMQIGTENHARREIRLHLDFGPGSLTRGGQDLGQYRNDWSVLPSLEV